MQISIFDFLRPRPRKSEPKSVPAPAERRRRPRSDAMLIGLWRSIRLEYFPQRPDIDDYVVHWSKRKQKRTLAACYTEEKRVIVARELNYSDLHHWLHPLLYHEMCHAVLGDDVPQRNGKRQWHGRKFKDLEARHPLLEHFNEWVHKGGWEHAVRSDRAKRAHQRRKQSEVTA